MVLRTAVMRELHAVLASCVCGNLTQARVIRERGPQLRKCLDEIPLEGIFPFSDH